MLEGKMQVLDQVLHLHFLDVTQRRIQLVNILYYNDQAKYKYIIC